MFSTWTTEHIARRSICVLQTAAEGHPRAHGAGSLACSREAHEVSTAWGTRQAIGPEGPRSCGMKNQRNAGEPFYEFLINKPLV